MVRDRVHGRGLWLQCRVWGRVNRVSVRVRVRVRVRLVNYVINYVTTIHCYFIVFIALILSICTVEFSYTSY